MLTRFIISTIIYLSLIINPNNFINNKISQEQEIVNQENQRIYTRARNASDLYCRMEGSEQCYITCMVEQNKFRCGIIGNNFYATLECREEEKENGGLYCSDQRNITEE